MISSMKINYFAYISFLLLACVYLTLSTRAKQAANLVFLFTFPLCETFLELKAKRDISHNIGYRTGKRVSSNRLRGRF